MGRRYLDSEDGGLGAWGLNWGISKGSAFEYQLTRSSGWEGR